MSAALKALAKLVAPEGDSSRPLELQLQAVEADCVEQFGVAFKQHEMAGCIVLSVWAARQAAKVGHGAVACHKPLASEPVLPILVQGVAIDAIPPGSVFSMDVRSGYARLARGDEAWAADDKDRVAASRDADLGQRALALIVKHEWSGGKGTDHCGAYCQECLVEPDLVGGQYDGPHEPGCEWGVLVGLAKETLAAEASAALSKAAP